MNNVQRTLVAVIAMIGSVIFGIAEHDQTITTTTFAVVLGYALGERNSERRQAQADVLARGGVAKQELVAEVLEALRDRGVT